MINMPVILLLLTAIIVLISAASCAMDARQSAALTHRTKIDLTPCLLASYATKVLCGKLEVFEGGVALMGRKIALHMVVLPALVAEAAPDPVFFLAGGPGQGAAKIAAAGEDSLMSQLRRRRDLVFIDQRGTGSSQPLDCNLSADPGLLQSYFDELFPVEKVRACRAALQRIRDLELYTTPIAVSDLDEARVALGYDKINLYGISYGTLMALQYLRRYPNNVRVVTLAGVTTPAAKLPLHYAKGAQHALDKLFQDCAGEDICRSVYPNLKADFAKVLAKLDEAPATFAVPHPETKEPQIVKLSRNVFAERLRMMLYNISTASLVPLIIDRAAREDWTAFARAVTRAPISSRYAPAMGMYLTVSCSESLPSISEDEISRETGGTFTGEYRIRAHQEACREWPQADIPADYFAAVNSPAPVLMLSGELDSATPAHLGAEAAKTLSNSRQIVLPATAHDYTSACVGSIVVQFITTASTAGLNTGCVERLRRPPFPIELPARHLR